MKKLVFSIFFSLSGCAADYGLQHSTLSSDDSVSLISAEVINPYPECDDGVETEVTRVADLSQSRTERVYLQKGRLCKRSQ